MLMPIANRLSLESVAGPLMWYVGTVFTLGANPGQPALAYRDQRGSNRTDCDRSKIVKCQELTEK